MKRSRSRRSLYKDLVRQRMQILYKQALDAARRGMREDAARLGGAIWRLHVETRIRMPRWMKRSLCKRCHIPLIPGVTATVRLRSQGCLAYKTVKCQNCGWIHRYPYRRRCRVEGAKSTCEGEAPPGSGCDNREEGADQGGPQGDREEA
ncbi:MAG: ribonuclease P [Desulfurococcales archaeon]|nr:ribonuclease P [Desulfurococcales archaeon]